MSNARLPRAATLAMILALTASLALSGCANSGDPEVRAQVEIAGDFITALLTSDGPALMNTLPDLVAEAGAESFAEAGDPDGAVTEKDWDGNILLLTIETPLGTENLSITSDETADSPVVSVTSDGTLEDLELGMMLEDGSWRVKTFFGLPVETALGINIQAPKDPETAQCFDIMRGVMTMYLGWEMDNREADRPADHAELKALLVELGAPDLPECPSGGKYTFDPTGWGDVECSVHGHY
ncbi:MAG: hypothetical protein PF636_05950 [Actinomycetota bacterium]|nr:hypothetical protein [Actinomycetota bacterium]